MNAETIEFWEKEYLKQIEYLLKLDKEKMIDGFNTKEYIKDDWRAFLGKETSEFATGAERIFYWLFNQFGQPNSSPIGSDLFFETYNAYIHIDIKTVTLANIGDYKTTMFVGNNQVSYSCEIVANEGRANERREIYEPHLPCIYTKSKDGKIEKKVCLTYFLTILYNEENLEVCNLSIMSVPNGLLYDIYKDDVFVAGKNPGKARFSFEKCSEFKLQGGKRVVPIFHINTLKNYNNKINKSKNKSLLTNDSYEKSMKCWEQFL